MKDIRKFNNEGNTTAAGYDIGVTGTAQTFDTGAVRNTKGGKGIFGDFIKAFTNRFKTIRNDYIEANHSEFDIAAEIPISTSSIMDAIVDGDYIMAIIRIATLRYCHESHAVPFEWVGSSTLLEESDILKITNETFAALVIHYQKIVEICGIDNWKEGIPTSSFIPSAMVHFIQYVSGMTDEDHSIAAIWNLVGAFWNEDQTLLEKIETTNTTNTEKPETEEDEEDFNFTIPGKTWETLARLSASINEEKRQAQAPAEEDKTLTDIITRINDIENFIIDRVNETQNEKSKDEVLSYVELCVEAFEQELIEIFNGEV